MTHEHTDDAPLDEASLSDEQLDDILATARPVYRVAPPADLDAMWRSINQRRERRQPQSKPTATWWRLAGVAAGLVLSFSLGRWSAPPTENGAASSASTVAADRPLSPTPVTSVTSELLGETAALLSAIPDHGDDPAADRRFAQQAGDLLATTRLLLDTRSGENDTALRTLLEDLELVLAQVARLRAGETRTERELITEVLQQQDLVPRIRTMAAGLSVGAD